MPDTDKILESLAIIANSWVSLAVLWHAYFGVLFAAALLGWRPSRRVAGGLTVPPLLSVSGLAWSVGNPFNGTMFALLALGCSALVSRLKRRPVSIAPRAWIAAGTMLSAFGWLYPHFLETGSFLAYTYAAPLGLIPCPTLSMLGGLSLIFGGLGSRAWILVLGVAGLFYGLFGAMHLDVIFDWALAVGAMCLIALLAREKERLGTGDD